MNNLLKDLYNIAKSMKLKEQDYIMLTMHDNNVFVFGIDESFTYMKTLEYQFKYQNLDIRFFNQTLYSVGFLNMIETFEQYGTKYNWTAHYINDLGFFQELKYNDLFIFDKFNIKNTIISKYLFLCNFIGDQTTPLEYKCFGEIRGNVDFETLLQMKSADGARPFIIDKYVMYIFTGLLPINKSDSVELEIYNRPNTQFFLSNFKITKKKQKINNYIFYYRL